MGRNAAFPCQPAAGSIKRWVKCSYRWSAHACSMTAPLIALSDSREFCKHAGGESSLLILLCFGRGDLEWSWGLFSPWLLYSEILLQNQPFDTKRLICSLTGWFALLAFPLFKEHLNVYINDRNLYINEVSNFFWGVFSWTPSAGCVVASVA